MKDRIVLMAMHHLSCMIPSKVVVKKKTWTPTILDSKDAFMKIAKSKEQISLEMNRRNAVCKGKGVRNHPIIFESGTEYFVGVEETIYECSSFIHAVDVAFKIFATLKIPFPPECVNVWMFLNEAFYRTNLKQKASAKLLSNLNYFKF